MNLYPLRDVIAKAQAVLASGGHVYQQWLCTSCGAKQTMSERDKFFTHGLCEVCGAETDLTRFGCNQMATWGVPEDESTKL